MSEFLPEERGRVDDFYDCVDSEEFTESDRVEEIEEINSEFNNDCSEEESNVDTKDSQSGVSEVSDELISQFESDSEIVADLEKDSSGCVVSSLEKNVDKAMMCKEEGNDYYRLQEYDTAVEMYSQAINLCPEDEEDPNCEEHRNLFAVFLGNRAAAFFALQEWDMVVDDCNWALDKKSDYVKIIVRRCQALENLKRIEEALNDAKRVKELDLTWPKIDLTISRLQKIHDQKMEEMKEEAMGKLKELGNSLLGNFGMSLDNFKFEQDPTTGSYSVGTK